MLRACVTVLLVTPLLGCLTDPETPAGPEADFRVVVMPDTQIYARDFPDSFRTQAGWIADSAEDLRVEFVLHEGDIVDMNNDEEWMVARESMMQLDGRVPYVLVPGNHDWGLRGRAFTRDTALHDYFDRGMFEMQTGFGGWFEEERLDNSFHLFETPYGPWLVLALEFGPRDVVLEWAKQVVDDHPGMPTILLTHSYLYSDDTRYDRVRTDQEWNLWIYEFALDQPVNDGEAIYQKLVKDNDQIQFVFSGHTLNDGLGYHESPQSGGGTVHEVLANYQGQGDGGDGFLRLIEFLTPTSVRIRTYSPVLNEYKRDAANEFTVQLQPF